MLRYCLVSAVVLVACGDIKDRCSCDYDFPQICLSITNGTSDSLNKVMIVPERGAPVGVGPFVVGEQRELVLQGEGGENTYRIVATTNNGDTIRGACGYFEGGYCLHNKVLADTITVEYARP